MAATFTNSSHFLLNYNGNFAKRIGRISTPPDKANLMGFPLFTKSSEFLIIRI